MGRDPLMIWGARSDTLYGLVNLMDRGAKAMANLGAVPTLYLYGAHDDIIPKNAAFAAVGRLKAKDRSAYYAEGYHLLTRDLQGPVVWADVLAFIRDEGQARQQPAHGGRVRAAAVGQGALEVAAVLGVPFGLAVAHQDQSVHGVLHSRPSPRQEAGG